MDYTGLWAGLLVWFVHYRVIYAAHVANTIHLHTCYSTFAILEDSRLLRKVPGGTSLKDETTQTPHVRDRHSST